MPYETPEELYYLESHEWIRIDGQTGVVGITDLAQDELGDILYVELPAVGTQVGQGEVFGLIESMKATADLYSPLEGEVTAVNDAVESDFGLVNDDPYGDGWLITLRLADPTDTAGLLSASAYRESVR